MTVILYFHVLPPLIFTTQPSEVNTSTFISQRRKLSYPEFRDLAQAPGPQLLTAKPTQTRSSWLHGPSSHVYCLTVWGETAATPQPPNPLTFMTVL